MHEYRIRTFDSETERALMEWISQYTNTAQLIDKKDIQDIEGEAAKIWYSSLGEARRLVELMNNLPDREQRIARGRGLLRWVATAFELPEAISPHNTSVEDSSLLRREATQLLSRSIEKDHPTDFTPVKGKLGVTLRKRRGLRSGIIDPRGVIAVIKRYGLTGDEPLLPKEIAKKTQFRQDVIVGQLQLANYELRKNRDIRRTLGKVRSFKEESLWLSVSP